MFILQWAQASLCKTIGSGPMDCILQKSETSVQVQLETKFW